MKKFVRVLSLVLSVALLCALCAVPASAAEPGVVVVSTDAVFGMPGQEVTVNVKLDQNPGLIGMGLLLTYDESQLTLVDTVDTELLNNGMFEDKYHTNYGLLWADGAASSDNTETGIIAALTFKINENASCGDEYQISITKDGNMTFGYGDIPRDVEISTESITVGTPSVTPLEDFDYYVIEDKDAGNSIIISGYHGFSKDVKIASEYYVGVACDYENGEPHTYNATYKVTALEKETSYYEDMQSIIIPETVNSIDAQTFMGLTDLATVIYLNKSADAEIGSKAIGYSGKSKKVDGFKLYGYTDSAANAYATTNTLTFVPLDGKSVSITAASLTLSDNIAVNFFVPQSSFTDLDIFENPYFSFSMPIGEKTTVTQKQEIFTAGTKISGVSQFKFAFTDIAPQYMGNTINAELHATVAGVDTVLATKAYSIKEYCVYQLKNSDNSKLKTLCIDTLNYGAATQNYVKYKTSELVNADCDGYQSMATPDRTFNNHLVINYETIDNPSVAFLGALLRLDESVKIKYIISSESYEGLTFKFKVGTEEYVVEEPVLTDRDAGGKIFEFDMLNPAQFSEPVLFTVYKGDTAVSNTLQYSVESYAFDKKDSTVTNLPELVVALMKYGDAAKAFVS